MPRLGCFPSTSTSHPARETNVNVHRSLFSREKIFCALSLPPLCPVCYLRGHLDEMVAYYIHDFFVPPSKLAHRLRLSRREKIGRCLTLSSFLASFSILLLLVTVISSLAGFPVLSRDGYCTWRLPRDTRKANFVRAFRGRSQTVVGDEH